VAVASGARAAVTLGEARAVADHDGPATSAASASAAGAAPGRPRRPTRKTA
jgi:hypothetical protein